MVRPPSHSSLSTSDHFLPLKDITTDGFGFMLAVGDLLWVPFTYSTTARYLALHPNDIGLTGTLGIVAVELVGYWIFRSSNNEKNEFRKGNNPNSASRPLLTLLLLLLFLPC
jgi:delta14-sterol reductase